MQTKEPERESLVKGLKLFKGIIDRTKHINENIIIQLNKYPQIIPAIPYIFASLISPANASIISIIIAMFPELSKSITGSLIANMLQKGMLSRVEDIDKLTYEELKKISNEISELIEKIVQNLNENAKLQKYLEDIDNKLITKEDIKDVVSEVLQDFGFTRKKYFDKVLDKLGEIKKDTNEIKKAVEETKNTVKEGNDTHIPTIEKELCKESAGSAKCINASEPEFFRKTGPMWIDFEKGYVFERKEVDTIVSKLNDTDTVVIKGNPASGKSVILRNIGYRLAKNGSLPVYYIPLKKAHQISLTEFQKIKSGAVIIDDAHLNIELTENLIRVKNKEVKLIIGTRNINLEEIRGPTNETFLEGLLKNAIEIKAKNAAEGIIEKYEEKNGKILEEIKSALIKNAEHHLWILAWKLKTYEKYKNLKEESFYDTVKKYIENLYPENRADTKSIIFILSVFYKNEIPVRKPFPRELIDSNDAAVDNTISKLIEKNEISNLTLHGKEYIALHHSEIARIYYDTFGYFTDFGSKIKKKISELAERFRINTEDSNEPYIETVLLINYTEEHPEEFNNLIGETTNKTQDVLLRNKAFLNLIPRILENYEPFSNVRTYEFYAKLGIIIRNNNSLYRELNNISKSIFEKKIEEWNNVGDMDELLRVLNNVGYKELDNILSNIDLDILKNKIRNCTSMWNISFLLITLQNVKYENLYDIINYLDVGFLKSRTDTIGDITYLFDALKEIDYIELKNIINSLGIEFFKKKIEEGDIGSIARFFEILKEINYIELKNIINSLGIELFKKKIEEGDIGSIAYIIITLITIVGYRQINKVIISNLRPRFLAEKVKLFKKNYRSQKSYIKRSAAISIAYFERLLKELNYPYINELKKMLEPEHLWLVEKEK